jgi:hypothetical protein
MQLISEALEYKFEHALAMSLVHYIADYFVSPALHTDGLVNFLLFSRFYSIISYLHAIS